MTQALPTIDISAWTISFAQGRHRIHLLEIEKATIARAMEALVWRFSSTLAQPPVRPALQKMAQGHLYVRWRLPGGQQPYVDMAGVPGRTLLQSLSVDMQPLLVQYVREAMCLNLAHSVRQSEWIRLRQFVADYESMNSIRSR